MQPCAPPPPPRRGSRDITASPAGGRNLGDSTRKRGFGCSGPTRVRREGTGISAGEPWPGRAAAELPVWGRKPSGFHSSQLGQAFQGSQAPTDFHFVFFKTDRVAVSFPTTFSRFNLRPMQTPQTFSTGISQGRSFSPAAFGGNQWSYARRFGLFLVWTYSSLFSDLNKQTNKKTSTFHFQVLVGLKVLLPSNKEG